MMKTARSLLLALTGLLALAACGRSEGGAAGYGAGAGQSLREGSTSPLHSSIAQDKTYQTLLGLNIILYPPPIDDPKFEAFGMTHPELDPTEFVQAMRDDFDGDMGEEPVFEPRIDALSDHPLLQQISETVFGGEPVQVGWIYGNNDGLDYLEARDTPVTFVTAENTVIFVGDRAKMDEATWTFDTKLARAFYIPANAVITINPGVLHSAPVRVANTTGQLTAVITPEGAGLQAAPPGDGFDQALVADGRWVFAFEGVDDYFPGLTGNRTTITAVD